MRMGLRDRRLELGEGEFVHRAERRGALARRPRRSAGSSCSSSRRPRSTPGTSSARRPSRSSTGSSHPGDPRRTASGQRPPATSTSTRPASTATPAAASRPPSSRRARGTPSCGASRRATRTRRRALMALVACPTGSIGTVPQADACRGVAASPSRSHENVSFCGFTAESSFGAWSYLIERAGGKRPRRLAARGGAAARRARSAAAASRLLFLTHRDDVADHAAFAKRFGCERMIHERDVTAATRGGRAEARGRRARRASHPDLLAIPTPGHTRGHAVLLYREQFLFTGDHLAWSPAARPARRPSATPTGTPGPSRSARWSGSSTIRFEWVLPGHGGRYQAESPAAMRRELENCVDWMKERGTVRLELDASWLGLAVAIGVIAAVDRRSTCAGNAPVSSRRA